MLVVRLSRRFVLDKGLMLKSRLCQYENEKKMKMCEF